MWRASTKRCCGQAESVQAASREESTLMVRVGIVGLGKMGLSHFSIIDAHDDVEVVGVCDSSGYVLDVSSKYTGVATFSDLEKMLDSTRRRRGHRDAVEPPRAMVRACLERGLHVFCEKPFCLDPADSVELAEWPRRRAGHPGRLPQPLRRGLPRGQALLDRARSARSPTCWLRPTARWCSSPRARRGGARRTRAAGACTTTPRTRSTWSPGTSAAPVGRRGTVLGKVFSAETEDEVFTTLDWPRAERPALASTGPTSPSAR